VQGPLPGRRLVGLLVDVIVTIVVGALQRLGRDLGRVDHDEGPGPTGVRDGGRDGPIAI
jgi:hypothetical protein